MRNENGEYRSDLFDVAGPGLLGADSLGAGVLLTSLRRLIDEAGSGLAEYSGFQNFLPGAVPEAPRTTDE